MNRNAGHTDPADPAHDARPATPRSSGVWERVTHLLHEGNTPPSNDATVAQGARGTSFDDLYGDHERFVWALLQRTDVDEDAAAGIHTTAFLTLHEQIRKNGPPGDVRALLATITVHLVCNHGRKSKGQKRRARFAAEVEADTLPSSKRDPEQLFSGAEERRMVHAILDRMPADAALLLRLVELCGMTPDEVAGSLGRPAGRLRVQLHRARATFRRIGEELYGRDLGRPDEQLGSSGSVHR